jgi:hypothetical protein
MFAIDRGASGGQQRINLPKFWLCVFKCVIPYSRKIKISCSTELLFVISYSPLAENIA